MQYFPIFILKIIISKTLQSLNQLFKLNKENHSTKNKQMKPIILVALFAVLFYSCSRGIKTAASKSGRSSKNTISTNQKQSDMISIDIVQSSPDQARVLNENQYVRVVEYTLNPGEKDIWHTHPPRSSYVVAGGKVRVYTEDGQNSISEVKTGNSSWAGHGAKHYVKNIGDTKIKIILTEVKALQ